MKRVCFLLQLRKERIADYLEAHQVWPEMLDAMREAGIRNYSLFHREDGMVVGYLEAEDPEESFRRLGETDVSRRWEEGMAEYFEGGERGALKHLVQYFHMP